MEIIQGGNIKMNLFKKVRSKLIIAFLVVSILIGVVGTIGVLSLKTVNIKADRNV